MKKSILILLLVINNICLGQEVSDTIILRKEANYKIYIEENRLSKQYFYQKDFSKFNVIDVLKNKKIHLPSKFIPLYLYKKSYYLSSPSDGYVPRIIIYNDSIYYEDYEIIKLKISSIKKINKKTFKFSEIDDKNNVLIKVVNFKKGIYVFKTIDSNKKISYKLMIDAEKANFFPIVVNTSKFERVKEFDFEKIDFEKLIK